MSIIPVGATQPEGSLTLVMTFEPTTVNRNITYTNISAESSFRGPNRFPSVYVVLSSPGRQTGYVEARFMLFSGEQIFYTLFTGGNTLIESIPAGVSSISRPLNVREGGAPYNPVLTITRDITVNDQGDIVAYNPANITNTLIYVFQLEYRVHPGTLTLTPLLFSKTNNINTATRLLSPLVKYVV